MVMQLSTVVCYGARDRMSSSNPMPAAILEVIEKLVSGHYYSAELTKNDWTMVVYAEPGKYFLSLTSPERAYYYDNGLSPDSGYVDIGANTVDARNVCSSATIMRQVVAHFCETERPLGDVKWIEEVH